MDELTARAARKEFWTFVRWFNEKVGTHPIIIGGWAVDNYNDYYGSKDIDVVFEGTKDVYEKRLQEFLIANGYHLERRDSFTETFIKKMKISGQPVEIDIDAADTSNANEFLADRGISLPYSLCTRHFVDVSSDGLTFRVPRLELLLAYRMKAYHDRNFMISQPDTAWQRKVEHYTSKRDKDGADIIALLDSKRLKQHTVFDDGFMGTLVRDHGFGAQAREVFGMIQDRPGSRHLYTRIGDRDRVTLLAGFSKRIFK